MRVIPAIDLRDGKCVRLAQGQKSLITVYSEEPVEVARQFVAAGADLIHVVDLDAAFGETTGNNRKVVSDILSMGAKIEVGGGIRTVADVERLAELGVHRAVLGTAAIETPLMVREVVERHGDLIAVGIDARDGVVMVRGWEQQSSMAAVDLAKIMVSYGVGRIIYTDISRDGMLTGPNVDQTVALARAAKVKVTASGGVSELDDIRRLRDAGEPLIDSVIVGKALYEGRLKLHEAIKISTEPGA
ncbi:MAG TPA: 1-(5-phosphoribosyl)-5-[(5-phosphoribosylamino)methylideneamino]imidazole-4-carboxamide isomerase [Pyrinomonadaceae bacterium]|nr:1-(5-phosphoribosyl)-5-[(5-phosphoribosylamino)methylideneamino]imidazole-4-carboxamide isomerase [Pyrinomonadaceae bacterium]